MAEAAETRQEEAGVGILGAVAGVETRSKPAQNQIAEVMTVRTEEATTVAQTTVAKAGRKTDGYPRVAEIEERDCSARGKSVSAWPPGNSYRVSEKRVVWESWHHRTAATAEGWKAAGSQNSELKAHRTTALVRGRKTKAHRGFQAVKNWAHRMRVPVETGEWPERWEFPESWEYRILERM